MSFLLIYLLAAKVLITIQSQYISNSKLVSLLFLPHGVRVLACMLYGPRLGAFYLFLTTFLTVFWVGAIENYSPFTLTVLYTVGALSVPLALIFLQFIHEDTKIGLTMVKYNTIKTIAYLALTSSLLNSIGQSVVLDGFSAFEVQPG